MGATRPPKRSKRPRKATPLMVRLDEESKTYLTRAAELRKVSVSDFVRTVTVAQARREVAAAQENILVLSPDEQLQFWNALNETPILSESQRELGRIMRGEK